MRLVVACAALACPVPSASRTVTPVLPDTASRRPPGASATASGGLGAVAGNWTWGENGESKPVGRVASRSDQLSPRPLTPKCVMSGE